MEIDSQTLLAALRAQRLISELDFHFARLVGRLAADDSSELAVAAALTSNRTGSGDICLDLMAWGGRTVGDPNEEAFVRLPDTTAWMSHLAASPAVCRPGGYAPLVLDDQGKLYLYRYWDYQTRLSEMLLQRAAHSVDAIDDDLLELGLSQLFPAGESSETDWQKVAAATAVVQRFAVISGGPGTGKTSTVVRILALLLQQAGEGGLAIALAAPTGKAAARLQESIESARQQLPVDDTLKEAIPCHALTLHRLLGSRPGSSDFRHHQGNRLSLDLLVIDEASMVDLALMTKVLQALPERARLILLGDRDQLASVEAGAVLADICGRQPAWTGAFRQRIERVCRQPLPQRQGAEHALANSIALLTRSYRFGLESGIGRLAQAVKSGDGKAAVNLLMSESMEDIHWHEGRQGLVELAVDAYQEYLGMIRDGHSAGPVIDAFNRFRVLAAVRNGPLGVDELNRQIEQALEGLGVIAPSAPWYPGRPVLILRNDYNLHLYNGDTGICMPTPEGTLAVSFIAPGGELRVISPNRIPACESAYAMTVHKSQGSEFDRVALVLPANDTPLLSRELIYTGITRARHQVTLCSAGRLLEAAVERRVERASGLYQALWD